MKTQLTLIIFFVCFVLKAQDNPYASFGYESEVKYETNISSLLTVHNADTNSIHKKIAFDFERKFVYYLNENDSILETDSFEGDNIMVWLSVDPLSSEYPSLSPYAFVADNPIIYIDPDGRRIVLGGNAGVIKKFENTINSSFGSNIIAKRDNKTNEIKLFDNSGKQINNISQITSMDLSAEQKQQAANLLYIVNHKDVVNLKVIDKNNPINVSGNQSQDTESVSIGSYYHGVIDLDDVLAISSAIKDSKKDIPLNAVDLILHETYEQFYKQNQQNNLQDKKPITAQVIQDGYNEAHDAARQRLNENKKYTVQSSGSNEDDNLKWTLNFENNSKVIIHWKNRNVSNVEVE